MPSGTAALIGRGMDTRFAHVRDWIFDLDNCLYPASTGLFGKDYEDYRQRVGMLVPRFRRSG